LSLDPWNSPALTPAERGLDVGGTVALFRHSIPTEYGSNKTLLNTMTLISPLIDVEILGNRVFLMAMEGERSILPYFRSAEAFDRCLRQ